MSWLTRGVALALLALASCLWTFADPVASFATAEPVYVYDPPTAVATHATNLRSHALDGEAASTASPRSSTSARGPRRAAKPVLKETRTGLGFTGHGADQLAMRGVRTPDALDAYRNPLQRGPIQIDELGRPGQKLIGRDATIILNPETNRIVTGYPTSTRIRNRLLPRGGD